MTVLDSVVLSDPAVQEQVTLCTRATIACNTDDLRAMTNAPAALPATLKPANVETIFTSLPWHQPQTDLDIMQNDRAFALSELSKP